MKTVLVKIMLWLAMLSVSACTTQLWRDTDPEQKIWINAGEISEAELESRGVEYKKYSTNSLNGFLVGKSEKEKLKDYTYRVLGTPVTLTVDAAGYAVMVGGVLALCSPELIVEILNSACN